MKKVTLSGLKEYMNKAFFRPFSGINNMPETGTIKKSMAWRL